MAVRLSLNHAAIVAAGGDPHGDFILFACPGCRRLYLHDYEHDLLYIDIDDLGRTVALTRPGDQWPCALCGFPLRADDIWRLETEPSLAPWLPTAEVVIPSEAEWLLSSAG